MAPLSYRAMIRAAGNSTVSYSTDFVDAHAVSPAIAHLGAWLQFDFRPPEARRSGGAGWKVHLSVDVAQAAAAWDAVLPVVAEARLLCKAVGPAILTSIGDGSHRQAGKAIVLYGHGHPRRGDPVFWAGVLADVEVALASAGVRPGWTVLGDRPVPGSAYAFVRNDADGHGRYAAAGAWFNPTGVPCPFDGLSVRASVAIPEHREAAADAVRQLRMVGGDWRREGEAATLSADAGAAGILARALAASGVAAVRSVDGLSVPAPRFGALRTGWFRAMQVARSAGFGRMASTAWEAASGERSAVVALVGKAGGDMPRCALEFATAEAAEAFWNAVHVLSGYEGTTVGGTRAVLPLPPFSFDGWGVDPRLVDRSLSGLAAPAAAAGPR